jgi:hypothetical protein
MLLPLESVEKVLPEGLDTELAPGNPPCLRIFSPTRRLALSRSISSSMRASMTSDGRKSIVACCGTSRKAAVGDEVLSDCWGVEGCEYGDVYCATFRFGDGGLDMSR